MSGADFFSFANAEFVGAKTVNGPLLDSVLTRPAFLTSETRVEKRASPAATTTIVSFIAVYWTGAAGAVAASAAMATSVVASVASSAFMRRPPSAVDSGTRVVRGAARNGSVMVQPVIGTHLKCVLIDDGEHQPPTHFCDNFPCA